jgi:hypothetical protein
MSGADVAHTECLELVQRALDLVEDVDAMTQALGPFGALMSSTAGYGSFMREAGRLHHISQRSSLLKSAGLSWKPICESYRRLAAAAICSNVNT